MLRHLQSEKIVHSTRRRKVRICSTVATTEMASFIEKNKPECFGRVAYCQSIQSDLLAWMVEGSRGGAD